MLHTWILLLLIAFKGFSHETSPNISYALPDSPDPVLFTDQFDVTPGSTVTSKPITIQGLTNIADISLIGGSYSINDGDFTSVPGTVSNNDQVRIRLNASAEYGQVTYSEISIGEVKAYFAVRTSNDPPDGWINVPGILDNIKEPDFPNREFNVTDFGAVGDGNTACTNAFKNAIDSCHFSGGGRVIVPDGIFLTGAIHLKSNVNLCISENAIIKFSTNPADYLPVVYTRFEGTECYNYSPLIYAYEQENIAITGSGTLDGQGSNEHWWLWTKSAGADVTNLRNQAEQGVPVEQRIYGEGHYLRPPMIQPYRCTNVFIDGVTILNGPFWHIHPVLCTNVLVTNISVSGHGPNNDGCNPESSVSVLIRNCTFDTGDDCIAVKSGRNADGRRINTPSENIVIQNCTMKDGHGGVVIGSEITGGAHNIYAEECLMDSPNLERALRIKTNSMRGGVVENIYLRNITVGQVSDAAIRVNYYYGEGDVGEFIPVVKNVEVRNMTCQKTNYALRIDGYERSPVSDLRLIDCNFINTSIPNRLNNIQNLCLNNVTIKDSTYNKIIEPFGLQPVFVQDRPYFSSQESELSQNWPNPFHTGTTITYRVNLPSQIQLFVYDNTGRQVMSLSDGFKEPGEYKVTYDAVSLFPGIYYYQLMTKQRSFIKQMIKF
jgi:hypothetical protein